MCLCVCVMLALCGMRVHECQHTSTPNTPEFQLNFNLCDVFYINSNLQTDEAINKRCVNSAANHWTSVTNKARTASILILGHGVPALPHCRAIFHYRHWLPSRSLFLSSASSFPMTNSYLIHLHTSHLHIHNFAAHFKRLMPKNAYGHRCQSYIALSSMPKKCRMKTTDS